VRIPSISTLAWMTMIALGVVTVTARTGVPMAGK
jgi:hypothetical protein